MADTVGILLGREVLRKVLAGKSSQERIEHYVAAAREYGVELLLFDDRGVNRRRGRIRGYVPRERGGFKRVRRSLPKVVYRRALCKSGKKAVDVWLERQGVYVFNSSLSWLDKYDTYRLLYGYRHLRPHLPETVLLSRQSAGWFSRALAKGREVFVKPRNGSLGMHVARVYTTGRKRQNYIYQIQGTRKRRKTRTGAWRLVYRPRRKKPKSYILQHGIALAALSGNRYDLRVPIQRGATGEWVITDMVVKRSGRNGYLTNVARGGTLDFDVTSVFAKSISAAGPRTVERRVRSLAYSVAEGISARHPRIADLGLDIGVDQSGHPWLIEVNQRPMRTTPPHLPDLVESHWPPIGYAAYLLRSS